MYRFLVAAMLVLILIIAAGTYSDPILMGHDYTAMTLAVAAVTPAAYTIDEFCKSHRVSRAFYYVMRANGWGPAEMRAGARVLVSYEAAAAWRREREAAASVKTPTQPKNHIEGTTTV